MTDHTTPNSPAAPSYVELTSQAYSLLTQSMASANQRALGYAKNVFEVLSRPYATNGVEQMARENFDRANQIVSLSVGELQTAGQSNSELAQQLAAHGAKWQDASATAVRGMLDTSLSNLKYVKETADKQIDDVSKHVEKVQAGKPGTRKH